jgi:prefoldin subunit 5
MIQELNDAAAEINAMKGDISQLQTDVDSLKQALAKQDTVISRLVEVTHVPRS